MLEKDRRSLSVEPIVAIGASGGQGLQDIVRLLSSLPGDLAAVMMVVLHRPVDRVSHLREVLARGCKMPVVIAAAGQHLKTGCCYIGEPDAHLTLLADSLAGLVADPENNYRNRTIDALFSSVAAHAGRNFIGIVLSGSLDDGSRGLAAIHEAGGATMVLTPSEGPNSQMGENAIAYDGPIDLIASAEQIANEIIVKLSGLTAT
jgi:two-component system chemotaxis response regulator CheB